nr:MAG TPA: Terminase small subunit [Caudoviricetes sp.]
MKETTLKQRIRAGKLTRADVARKLAELAYGRANDCATLVLDPGADAGKLDLSLLSEVKRSEKGAVEVKLLDRLKALEMLTALTEEGGEGMEEFLRALNREEG